ncbi:uncharacterized protein LOC130711924 isoform X2 [Lotus japonicus]|uniref:uncharacterized protein LOC130711924 isoform X2 n=1 Tax=Lotus japonicus TaxID=34305 RepID=UPI00258AE044|nr:uncharacterized protein LOC130711924 isoform X2 [Lotus japonicus]XP_057417694.1 uncharacterized protein LOC130711924 isoform X2 [Lotus japonicus]XP_057417695.1 uncharacterized protein LOC130711924 isoform X2 [Lotus japonicus]
MIFTGKTKVVPSESSSIPMWGLTLKTYEQVHAPDVQTDYLDMVGLVSAASTERSYMKEGKEVKILTLELTDDKGKVKLTVSGEYVAVINDYLSSHFDGKPVVVVELAKIKTFKGICYCYCYYLLCTS